MSANINNQYDFFKNVNLDANGNIGVVFSGGTGSSSQPFLYTADNYTDLGTVTGMTEGDLAYVADSEGTSWLPGTVGGTYYPQGVYVYVSGTWVSDRNAMSIQLELNKIETNPITTVTGSTNIATDAYTINVNSTSDTTQTLPTAVGVEGKEYKIKNSDSTSAGVITLATTASQTIDGNNTILINYPTSIAVQSDGANWIII